MDVKKYPKVLIISHNLYDQTNNIGKTLVSLFKGWPKEKISQLYFRNDKPSFEYCDQYYCITDKDILKSFVSLNIRRAGKVVEHNSKMLVSKNESNLYQIGNHRRPIVSFIRDVLWSCNGWKSKEFAHWLTDVAKPDIILFVPNDYCLAYRITLYVEEILKKPIIPFYMDDAFYYGCKTSLLDQFRRFQLRQLAKRIHLYSDEAFTICKYMSDEYKEKFNLNCREFVNSVAVRENVKQNGDMKYTISYLGNLHSNRWKALVEIGEALDCINNEREKKVILKIYSGSNLEKNIRHILESIDSINLMGSVSPELVREKQLEADILVHVEAFDRPSVNSTRLSLSTKIPEYLSTGVCMFAYGPSNIASMKYLYENSLAQVCFEKSALKAALQQLIDNSELRETYAMNGYRYAKQFHDIDIVSGAFQHEIFVKGNNYEENRIICT